MKRSAIPTIFAIFILVAGVALGVFLVQQQQTLRLGASPDKMPRDVKVTNIGNNSFTVSWVTDKEFIGFVNWGEDENLGKTAQESTESEAIHFIKVANLAAGKTYYFKINSGGEEFDNSGTVWQVQTLNSVSSETIRLSGKILQENGQVAGRVIAYATLGGMAFSSQTTTSGDWVISTNSFTAKPADNSLVEIFVQGGSLGIASAQIYLSAANPTPTITLGRVYDFKNETGGDGADSTKATLELPIDTTEAVQTSKFENATDSATDDKTGKVTIDSLAEGETVYTETPEFFGTAPAGAEITIKIESELVVGKAVASSSGDWEFAPPEGLEPGNHKITISWKDALGVVHSVTRNFEVLASDMPAFESTPSASPTASPKSSPTPTATPASNAASPKASPRVSVPSTESGVPTPGMGMPTIFLIIAGVGLLCTGIIISRRESY